MRRLMTAALLVAAPAALSAGELAILMDKQFGKAQSANLLYFGLKQNGQYDAVSPTGFGLRGGYSVLDLKVAEIGLEATYHTQTEGDVIIAGVHTGQKLSNQYVAIGAKAEWKFLTNLYVGMELRQEKLSVASESVTYTRPWTKVGIGGSLPIPVLAPFIRLEYAFANTKDDKTDSQSAMVKALAPQYQLALVAGIKF